MSGDERDHESRVSVCDGGLDYLHAGTRILRIRPQPSTLAEEAESVQIFQNGWTKWRWVRGKGLSGGEEGKSEEIERGEGGRERGLQVKLTIDVIKAIF